MAQYGQIIDMDYHPDRDNIYKIFIEYFGDLTMTKIKDINNYSMYAAKIHSSLGIEHRYVFIFVINDKLPLGTTDLLSTFQWENLQTRSMYDNHNIQPQFYTPRRLPSLLKKINLVNKDPKGYVYDVDSYPLQIILLPKKNESMSYQPTGNIVTALETYQTIVVFRE